jgi:hypothetical protein
MPVVIIEPPSGLMPGSYYSSTPHINPYVDMTCPIPGKPMMEFWVDFDYRRGFNNNYPVLGLGHYRQGNYKQEAKE